MLIARHEEKHFNDVIKLPIQNLNKSRIVASNFLSKFYATFSFITGVIIKFHVFPFVSFLEFFNYKIF